MSREIKFRAWDYEMKSYIYPNERQTVTQCCSIIELLTNREIPGGIYKTDITYSCNGILEQYVGLTDKNGKDIYEGDIIYLKNWNPQKWLVVFDRGGFCLKFGDDAGYYPDIKYAENSEVVGNVHTSPELLKGATDE